MSKRPLQMLTIMERPSLVRYALDTSWAVLEEARSRGHDTFFAEARDLSLSGSDVVVRACPARAQRDDQTPIVLGASTVRPIADFDVVFMRSPPASDERVTTRRPAPPSSEHHHACLILKHARGRTLIVNDPVSLASTNSKLLALEYPGLVPPTIVTRDAERVRAFQRDHGGVVVVKPIDGSSGAGVLVLSQGDRNTPAALDLVTDWGLRWVVAQQYLPSVRAGETRVALLDGEPVRAVRRTAADDDHRGNRTAGATVVPCELSERERAICAALAPRLRASGLYLAGVDIIDGWLIEVNVDCPSCFPEVPTVDGVRVESRLVDWVESKLSSRRVA